MSISFGERAQEQHYFLLAQVHMLEEELQTRRTRQDTVLGKKIMAELEQRIGMAREQLALTSAIHS